MQVPLVAPLFVLFAILPLYNVSWMEHQPSKRFEHFHINSPQHSITWLTEQLAIFFTGYFFLGLLRLFGRFLLWREDAGNT